MPSYERDWLAIWTPVLNSANQPNASTGTKAFVVEVTKSNITQRLKSVDEFYSLLEDYKAACSNMKKHIGNESLAEKEQEIHNKLLGYTQILGEAVLSCRSVVQAVENHQGGAQSLPGIHDFMKLVMNMSNQFTKDNKRFNREKIGFSLEEIRRTV